MIHFKKIKFKNLLSYGNAWTEVDLRQGKVLLSGVNGGGKSQFTDGLSFALFGKPFRKINIPQLINSINGKDTQVELEFSVNGVEYEIKRGLRPSKFEIYQDGELIKQEAATRDYQQYLEKNILKINHKTFVQILVLGSAVFTPFMQLPAGQRRQVIEDILGINVFSQMMRLLKEKIQLTKEELKIIEVHIDSAKKETAAQKRLIETISSKNNDHIASLELELSAAQENESVIVSQLADVVSTRDTLISSLISFDSESYEQTQIEYTSLKKEIKTGIDKANRVESIDVCPTCMQQVSVDHKHRVKNELHRQYEDLKPKLTSLETSIDKLKRDKIAHDDLVEKIKNSSSQIVLIKQKLESERVQIISIQKKISEHKFVSANDVDREKEKLRSIAQKALELIERKNELITEKQIQEVSLGLLKDTGIKASIIKEYLPIINKVINKSLADFDFFINFILDENFDEKLLARGRDTASYMSLSEGEKKRIDVAILMAFRYIAGMKNSAKLDLLFLDEMDSGLDHESRLKLLEMIQATEGNVWMISHNIQNTELEQQFDKIATVLKKGDFSELTLR